MGQIQSQRKGVPKKSRINRASQTISQQPIWVLVCQLGFGVQDEWRQPNSWDETSVADFSCQRGQALWKSILKGEPISYLCFKAIVDLDDF